MQEQSEPTRDFCGHVYQGGSWAIARRLTLEAERLEGDWLGGFNPTIRPCLIYYRQLEIA
ncbi:MAG TPA: hypothetical protein VMW80_13600 [Candidatus Dormibacteraeota bacterium]|nr:hypothetical protein [Candidatus Dormibacteraeota bacterium]